MIWKIDWFKLRGKKEMKIAKYCQRVRNHIIYKIMLSLLLLKGGKTLPYGPLILKSEIGRGGQRKEGEDRYYLILPLLSFPSFVISPISVA